MTNNSLTRRGMIQAVGVAGITGVAGCASLSSERSEDGTASSDPYESGTGTGEPTQQSSSTTDSATIALASDVTADYWDIYSGVMPYYTNVLEPLVWVTDEMELKPWLATEWTQTSDTTWEFTLREAVKFHNGESFTADAVVFSFEEILSEWSYASGWLHLESGSVQALDDRTVEFTTTDPSPTFPGTIAHNMVAVQHPSRERTANDPIGTGPFTVEEVDEQQSVTVRAFEDYWGETSQLAELTFRVIEDPNTRSLALDAGEVDIAYQPPRSKLQHIERSDQTTVEVHGSPSTGYVGINLYNSPTDDVKLRQALNYAVPRQKIVDSVLNGIGKPARGTIAPSIFWSAHDSLPEYGPDMEKATRLVDESSYAGEELRFIVGADMTDGKLLAQAVGSCLVKREK